VSKDHDVDEAIEEDRRARWEAWSTKPRPRTSGWNIVLLLVVVFVIVGVAVVAVVGRGLGQLASH
jgi:hypothetical protein